MFHIYKYRYLANFTFISSSLLILSKNFHSKIKQTIAASGFKALTLMTFWLKWLGGSVRRSPQSHIPEVLTHPLDITDITEARVVNKGENEMVRGFHPSSPLLSRCSSSTVLWHKFLSGRPMCDWKQIFISAASSFRFKVSDGIWGMPCFFVSQNGNGSRT